jgi:cell division protein FtsL
MTAQVIPFPTHRTRAADGRAAGRGPRILPLAFFVLAVVAIFFAMIFLRISLDETAFDLARIETDIEAAESRQLDLRYDLAGLQDPLRIATEAQRIGLIYPEIRVTLAVDPLATDAQILQPEIPVRALNEEQP